MNELLQQKLTDEEARLAQKLYELGKGRTMVFGDRSGKIWKQTPAGSRGMYLLSLKRQSLTSGGSFGDPKADAG
jgi:hypothetical protein